MSPLCAISAGGYCPLRPEVAQAPYQSSNLVIGTARRHQLIVSFVVISLVTEEPSQRSGWPMLEGYILTRRTSFSSILHPSYNSQHPH